MNSFFQHCLLCAAIIGIASADIPRKAPLVKYTGLWTNSPFTSKPVIESGGTVANPLDDFTLAGIAPVPGGYRITIMNKKNPDIRKVIEPGVTGEFTVVSVNRNPEKTLGTTVVLSSGSNQGTVSFEPDLLTLKPAPVVAENAIQQPLPPGVVPPTTNNQNPNPPDGGNIRQPRPRIVQPPATPGANQAAPTTGGAPQGRSREDRFRRR